MAYLVLQNGTVFEGTRCGADGDAIGELVFTTGMVGYPETLTDPAYAGQIVMQTFPMVGNYGIIPQDIASTAAPRGYVVRELCGQPSNFRCEQTLDDFLRQQNVVGLCGVDTRELTNILREQGTMNALICDTVPEELSALAAYTVAIPAGRQEVAVYPAVGDKRFSVALLDLGASVSLLRALCEHGCEVTALPANTPAEAILALKADGLVLSGGPGDPAAYSAVFPVINELFGRLPMLGVGLGHQLIALARGGATEKLHHGHRGANQPVRQAGTPRVHITTQNHGYVVSELPQGTFPYYRNANDGTCEGIDYPNRHCVTVQFEPNGAVLTRFTEMMGGADNA